MASNIDMYVNDIDNYAVDAVVRIYVTFHTSDEWYLLRMHKSCILEYLGLGIQLCTFRL